jgi:hypothetical protein
VILRPHTGRDVERSVSDVHTHKGKVVRQLKTGSNVYLVSLDGVGFGKEKEDVIGLAARKYAVTRNADHIVIHCQRSDLVLVDKLAFGTALSALVTNDRILSKLHGKHKCISYQLLVFSLLKTND